MPLNEKQNREIGLLAKQLINSLRVVELEAERALQEGSSRKSSAVFVTETNPMVSSDLAKTSLELIFQAVRQDLSRINHEPFIVYVLAEDDAGEKCRFYIARGTLFEDVADLKGRLVSYRGPFGRLAECPAGESIKVKLPNQQKSYTILERARIRPCKEERGWDGLDDQIEASNLRVEIESLLNFLSQLAATISPEDYYGTLLDEAKAAKVIREGIRRGIVQRMSLRDQPTLDRYQGEIFRLPLNRRLILIGAPGTGKTTTLIRRLAQKRSAHDISEEELGLVPEDQYLRFFHPNNWLMYTPTELLRQYLKEAFAKEGIASPDERIRTWSEQRRIIGRDVFRVLRSELGGRFILEDEKGNLLDSTSRGLMSLADEFFSFFKVQVVERYEQTFDMLERCEDDEILRIIELMRPVAGGTTTTFDNLFDLFSFHENFREHIQRLDKSTKKEFSDIFNRLYAKKGDILNDLTRFLATLSPELEEEGDDETEEEDDDALNLRDPRMAALETCRRAIYARARSLHERRPLARSSRNWKVLEWLDQNVPGEVNLEPLGKALGTLRRVRFLSGTHRNLISHVPVAFQRFRRAALRQGKWYRPESRIAVERGRINGAELDIILYTMLRQTHRFFLQNSGRWLQEDTHISILENVKAAYVTQVLIDEVTDFSPVQVVCMMELAHPKFQSCFMCGDVLQRVTQWGISDISEFSWISADCEVREVEIGYRMSRKLLDLALVVATMHGGKTPSLEKTDLLNDSKVPPLLHENLKGGDLAYWLCERICEIERSLAAVPSIAIFVECDEQIDPLLEKLRPLLAEHNLEVAGCKEGRFIGVESQIRIFDIQYVKGLEFEAVFFVGADRLISRYKDLYDKFLFVGITRAATYLGLTCDGRLPQKLEVLRPYFSSGGWE